MCREPNTGLLINQLLKLGKQTGSQKGTIVHFTLPSSSGGRA
jgi:hypothetical protein